MCVMCVSALECALRKQINNNTSLYAHINQVVATDDIYYTHVITYICIFLFIYAPSVCRLIFVHIDSATPRNPLYIYIHIIQVRIYVYINCVRARRSRVCQVVPKSTQRKY